MKKYSPHGIFPTAITRNSRITPSVTTPSTMAQQHLEEAVQQQLSDEAGSLEQTARLLNLSLARFKM